MQKLTKDEYRKNCKRIPILINPQTIVLLRTFDKIYCHEISDLYDDFFDSEYVAEHPDEIAQEAAEEFVNQLNDLWTPRFMQCLRSEIDKRLKEAE